MSIIDVFKPDAFNQVEMTMALNRMDTKPQLLQDLGIFQPMPVRTIQYAIEKREQRLSLIQTSLRGAALEDRKDDKRDIRDFRTVRIGKSDQVNAHTIQGLRAFGTEDNLEQVVAELSRRQLALRDDVDLTKENHRLGAVQGKVLDADGSVINDWFSEWGITEPAAFDFDFGNATPASGAIRTLCQQVRRVMVRAAKGAFNPNTQVVGLTDSIYFDKLIAAEETRETFKNQPEASQLREGTAFSQFKYGGINFIEYQGTDDSKVRIPDDTVRFFPINAPGVFQVVWSPSESIEFVNTLGQPLYAIVLPDPSGRNFFLKTEVYAYPSYICTHPAVLQSGLGN